MSPTKTIEYPTILNAADTSNPALRNLAVARCTSLWRSTFRAELERDQCTSAAARTAAQAYCSALPLLLGDDNIRDFVACVAQGLLIDAIDEKKATKLLHAVHIASSAVAKISSKSASKPRFPLHF